MPEDSNNLVLLRGPSAEDVQRFKQEHGLRSLPPHLRDDASYLRCTKCGRKSYGGDAINSVCGMSVPQTAVGQWKACDGILEGKTA